MDNKRDVLSGIYKIENIINGKFYIGSSKDIYKRWDEHEDSLENGEHCNRYLQRAWDKYGANNFKFSIIELCDENIRISREQYYLDKTKCYENNIGYNISKRADCIINSEETMHIIADKLREVNKGENSPSNIYPKETIKKCIEDLLTGEFSYQQISDMYNIPYSTVASLTRGVSWRYLTKGIDFPKPKKSSRKNVKLTENNVKYIVKLMHDGYTNDEIAKLFNVHRRTISDIRNHKTWKEITKDTQFIRNPRNKKYAVIKDEIIRMKLETNLSNIKIAKIFDVSSTFVTNVLKQNK